ncbi:MAG: hypothetical protein ACHREM_29655 [Polyangiales bacterium]
MRTRSLAMIVVGSLAIAGCVSTQATPISTHTPAKADDCSVEIVDTLPAGPLALVGTVDVYDAVGKLTISVDDLKKKLRTPVCRLGGDLAVYGPRDNQIFVRAIVYRRVASPN